MLLQRHQSDADALRDRTSAVLDALPAGIFETDIDGRCRFVNRRWLAYTGMTFEQALGYGWADGLHPADRELVLAEWAAAVLERRDFALEFRFLRPDGSAMWVAGVAAPILRADGLITGYFGTVTDISALVNERLSQVDERRFVDAVLEIAGALVCVFDGDGRILRFNRACELLTGYSFEEVRGRPFYDFLVPLAEIEGVRADLARLQPGQLPTPNENNWLTRDGRLRLIAWSDACFFDDQGHATHLISTGIDVTDERRGVAAMRAIEAVGALLAKTGPTAQSMAAILATLSDRMGYPSLALHVRRGERFELGAQIGLDGRVAELDPTSGLVARVLETGGAAFVERAGVDGEPGVIRLTASSEAASQIAVPLTADGGTLGVLSIESPPEAPLTSADLRLIETVAERLSAALVLAREQEALTERARLFAALNGFAQAAGAMVDEDSLATAVLDGIADVVPHDGSWLTLLDRDSQRHVVRAVRGTAFRLQKLGREVMPGVGPSGRAIERRALVVERQLERGHPTWMNRGLWQDDGGALVAVPLVHDQVVLGTMVVGRAGREATFTNLECEVLSLLGAQAALASTNARLLAEVRALAIRDPLTGLFNRRHFDAAAEHMLARWKRDRATAKPLAAIMFDLDRFGQLNNTFGHQAGDAVLQEFAGILLTRFRSADLVARYGGEEFVVVMDGATVADAAALAEEIRRDFQACVVLAPDGHEVRATVSAGCAEIDPSRATREALIETADVALFAAKRAGRNRVVRGRSNSTRDAA